MGGNNFLIKYTTNNNLDSPSLQVKAVLFAIESNVAAIALHGTMAKLFFQGLCPQHAPPQNLPFMRIVRLLDLAVDREYRRLINDNVEWLGTQFASTNSDFYQCPERREAYGCIVANMCGMKYIFNDGRSLFVSKQTLNKGCSEKIAIEEGQLAVLETVISFRRFDGAKTGHAIGTWMVEQHQEKGLLPSYVGYHSTDGASNAVSSVEHYKLLTEMNQQSAIQHDKCMAHQNNRSAKYASGTGDYRENSNPVLGEVLDKAHRLIARVHRSSKRIKVVRDFQITAKRSSIVLPIPSVVTRWDSSNLEVASLNRIMGDFNKALVELIDGDDKKSLTDSTSRYKTRQDFFFSKEDRMILRQFECGSEPCLKLSKFFQLNEATCHETLFVTTARLGEMMEQSFLMFGDISYSQMPNLRNREKTVKVTDQLGDDDEGDDGNERSMDPCISLYRELYATDMAKRCGLMNEDGHPATKFPTMIAMACLLNPIYGGESQTTDVIPLSIAHV